MPGPANASTAISPNLAAVATFEEAARGLGNVSVRRGDASRPPFAPGRSDAALASLVLYVLPEPAVALRRWLEVLQPGGTTAFSWGIHPDPRWSPVFAAVDDYAKGADGFETYVRRLGSADEMTVVLKDCGYSDIQISAETVPVRYTGPRQWWQASWAEAPMLAWQHIPDADRDEARRAAFALLDGIREPDGGLVRQVAMAYAIARRPPEDDGTGHGPGKAAIR